MHRRWRRLQGDNDPNGYQPISEPPPSAGIGTLGEKSLHAALKAWVSQPGDQLEVKVDGYVIDVCRPAESGQELIEIQTRSFSALKTKLSRLLEHGHRVHLLHPVAARKWIRRESATGELISRRKSPKAAKAVEAFRELVYLPHLLNRTGFTFSVILTHQEEVWRDDGQGSWRRKGWSRFDNRLLEVVDTVTMQAPEDYLKLIPLGVADPFTNRELATALKIRPNLAQKMTYTLAKAGLLHKAGKKSRAHLYARSSAV